MLDWLLKLPEDLAHQFWKEMQTMEQRLPYVDSLTRIGREVGREEGRAEGRAEEALRSRRLYVLEVLRARFGDAPEWAEAAVAVADESRLGELLRLAATAADLTAFRTQLDA